MTYSELINITNLHKEVGVGHAKVVETRKRLDSTAWIKAITCELMTVGENTSSLPNNVTAKHSFHFSVTVRFIFFLRTLKQIKGKPALPYARTRIVSLR